MGTAAATSVQQADLDLVERHRYGDPEAFEEVYGQFECMVYNLALRMSCNEQDAADLTQEVFLRVYRHLSGFRGRSSLKTWVFRVALNCCRSGLRRRKAVSRVHFQPPEDELDRVPDPTPGPETRALSRDMVTHLERALGSLPLPFREAVILRDVQGFSYGEIALILRVRIGTVRSRIARGRDRIRTSMESSL